MKQKLQDIIYNAAKSAFEKGDLPSGDIPEIEVEEPRADAHGDFSTNIAMVMASIQKMAPRKIADAIIVHLQDAQQLI
jgi:arginyl-tRNA synthetase